MNHHKLGYSFSPLRVMKSKFFYEMRFGFFYHFRMRDTAALFIGSIASFSLSSTPIPYHTVCIINSDEVAVSLRNILERK